MEELHRDQLYCWPSSERERRWKNFKEISWPPTSEEMKELHRDELLLAVIRRRKERSWKNFTEIAVSSSGEGERGDGRTSQRLENPKRQLATEVVPCNKDKEEAGLHCSANRYASLAIETATVPCNTAKEEPGLH